MIKQPLPRIDLDKTLRKLLLPFCRLKKWEIWEDPLGKHKVGCMNAAEESYIKKFFGRKRAVLAIQDPPYNFVAFKKREINNFIEWCKDWINNSYSILKPDSSLYIWLGADQKFHFQPLSQFIQMMSETMFNSRSFITMRNQRGYGTQKNWMSVRQELLYYIKGNPKFYAEAEYTDIPKVLKGYYKTVNGKKTENLGRSKSKFIRAGNVWVDVQQIFYRMEENVNGCYAQKPIKSIIRIIEASSKQGELITDFFSHSGATLISAELKRRKCYTVDIDPVFCEISIRRLEKFRESGETGWQNSNPFADEIKKSRKIKSYLKQQYNLIYDKLQLLDAD
ncbi:MAG: site-specific DNA-methyltransferase [Ignavibacteria bacterium]|nr:site-specific DNA-methyltransferase [Ignavibacteria bacterium]